MVKKMGTSPELFEQVLWEEGQESVLGSLNAISTKCLICLVMNITN